MAMDEVLLAAAPEVGTPVLRFYQWTEPAATFGYFQRFAEVERLTHLRPLIRRPTGGGLVPHDADWTYSLVFPPTDGWYRLSAVESYRRLHEWIQAAFRAIGTTAELSPESKKELRGQCFSGPEQFDLVWHDRKIAGAAQRRTRQGLLIQGSIQPPPTVAKSRWQEAFSDIARSRWGVTWLRFDWESSWEERVKKMAQEKYTTRQYNERR
jgi:lipoate-protein ligase A